MIKERNDTLAATSIHLTHVVRAEHVRVDIGKPEEETENRERQAGIAHGVDVTFVLKGKPPFWPETPIVNKTGLNTLFLYVLDVRRVLHPAPGTWGAEDAQHISKYGCARAILRHGAMFHVTMCDLLAGARWSKRPSRSSYQSSERRR